MERAILEAVARLDIELCKNWPYACIAVTLILISAIGTLIWAIRRDAR